jgi:hypothetical protein
MRRQRALAGTTLAGSKDNDIHASFLPSRLERDDFRLQVVIPL